MRVKHPPDLAVLDDHLLSDCVHCGLCLETCPTFVETGLEAESPRGRLTLIQGLATGRWHPQDTVLEHLDLCLGCRACETACPSGVQYGRILERTRGLIAPLRPRPRHRGERFLIRHVLWRPRLLSFLAGFIRFVRLWRPARVLARIPAMPRSLRSHLRLIPRPEPRGGFPGPIHLSTTGTPAILLRGCVARAVFPETEAAMVHLLSAAGYGVHLASKPDCCGALAHHLGEQDISQKFGSMLLDMVETTNGVVIPTAAGCSSHLKGLTHVFEQDARHDAARALADRVRDFSEALIEAPRTLQFQTEDRISVAYADACHLRHGQGIVEAPRQLLRAAGGDLREPEDADLCCGSAGSYNLSQAEMAIRLGERKAAALRSTGADWVITTNPGCTLQLEAHLGKPEDPRVQSLPRFLASRLAPSLHQ